MVKIEGCAESDDSSDVEVVDKKPMFSAGSSAIPIYTDVEVVDKKPMFSAGSSAMPIYTNEEKPGPVDSDSLDDLSSFDEEDNKSLVNFTTDIKEETQEELHGFDMDKRSNLLMMDFSTEEVDFAMDQLGESAPLTELVDFIITGQTANCLGEEDTKNKETDNDASFDLMDKTLRLLQMGFTEVEVTTAIDNSGHEVPIAELADSILAHRFATRVDKEEDSLKDQGSTNSQIKRESRYADNGSPECSGTWYSSTNMWETSSSDAVKRGKKKAKFIDPGTEFDRYAEHIECSTIKEEIPDSVTTNLNLPYIFYANVVNVPKETWEELSQFLYGIKPEYVNSKSFSALIREEGYLHNLPTKNRSHILPKPPITILDALPETRKWWPTWDTRKQLSCIDPEPRGVYQLCDRLNKMMVDSKDFLNEEQRAEILRHCKALNLVWAGQNRLSPVEPEQVECILGYPPQHTKTSFWSNSDRLRALKHGLQTDTLGYHLSVLKEMFPDGLRVLSIFTGIGGAELALWRLGFRLKFVFSIEPSDANRKILKRWWENSGQLGVLKQIESIEKLGVQNIEEYIRQFGGFDIVIGGNPAGIGAEDGSWMGMDMNMNLFHEFVRVFKQVKSIMGCRRR